jgi:hypothetical protein
MATYEITPDLAGMSRGRKALRIVFLVVTWVAVAIPLHYIWPSISSGLLLVDVIQVLITGSIWAFLMMAFYQRNLSYTVVVSDDGITAFHPWYAKSVQKNRVKTVLETKGNALVAPGVRISNTEGSVRFYGAVFGFPSHFPNANLYASWR